MHIIKDYPRLLLLTCSFAVAYVLYHAGFFDVLHTLLQGYGYVSIFLGGLLFSFGFTSPFGIAIFLEMAPDVHPVAAAIIGGIGAFLMDFAIFELLRYSAFHNELARLRETFFVRRIVTMLHHQNISRTVREYLLWCFAGFIIASPLPDEIGVSLVSGITDIDTKRFGLLCFAFNTVGIFVILLIAR
jgi:hypothetical protein